jgi:predicted alpha/beta hydrolase family esterase
MALERVTRLSERWGSNFIGVGPQGHISTADGFGPWPEGLQYIAEMQAAALATKQQPHTLNLH